MDEPNGSVTCTLLDGTGYTVHAGHGSGTTTIIDDDPTIASLVATSDVTFTEQKPTDTAAFTARLSRRLYDGEKLAVPVSSIFLNTSCLNLHDGLTPSYTVSVSGTGATGSSLTSDPFYVQFTGHDTDIVQEATVTLIPTNNGDADAEHCQFALETETRSSGLGHWTHSFTNVGGGGDRHGTDNTVRLTYADDDITVTLSVPDATAVEDSSDDAEIRVALSRALVSGETVTRSRWVSPVARWARTSPFPCRARPRG